MNLAFVASVISGWGADPGAHGARFKLWPIETGSQQSEIARSRPFSSWLEYGLIRVPAAHVESSAGQGEGWNAGHLHVRHAADALDAYARFVERYGAKYPKAVEKLKQNRDSLLAFYDFPAEHWQHLWTTNPIESTFATVRHRTTPSCNCLSRGTFLGLAYKLIEEAEKTWRRIRGAEKIGAMLAGVSFKDGIRRRTSRRNASVIKRAENQFAN